VADLLKQQGTAEQEAWSFAATETPNLRKLSGLLDVPAVCAA